MLSIMEWNVNGRSNHNNNYIFPANVVNIIVEVEKPDIFVLVEFVPDTFQAEDRKKLEEIYVLGWSKFEQGKKNSILIGVKKEKSLCVVFEEIIKGFASNELQPDYLKACITTKNGIFDIIGFRMLTGLNEELSKNYDMEKELFDCFIKNNINIGEGYQILVGDFNNAMHYGKIDKSFCEVENKYWTYDWDEIRKCYVGEKYKRAQYSYNLHVIKDALKPKGLILREEEDDYSFKDKYNNLIHDDHFFVDSRIEDKCTVEFKDFIFSTNMPDHRYFIGKINI